MVDYINDISNTPQAIGPYSKAVQAGDFVFLSGQLGLDPQTGKLVPGGIEPQTQQALRNIEAILKHLKLGFENIAKSTIFLVSLGDFQKVNALYEQALGGAKPARSTVQVAALPAGATVEIEVVAWTGNYSLSPGK